MAHYFTIRGESNMPNNRSTTPPRKSDSKLKKPERVKTKEVPAGIQTTLKAVFEIDARVVEARAELLKKYSEEIKNVPNDLQFDPEKFEFSKVAKEPNKQGNFEKETFAIVVNYDELEGEKFKNDNEKTKRKAELDTRQKELDKDTKAFKDLLKAKTEARVAFEGALETAIQSNLPKGAMLDLTQVRRLSKPAEEIAEMTAKLGGKETKENTLAMEKLLKNLPDNFADFIKGTAKDEITNVAKKMLGRVLGATSIAGIIDRFANPAPLTPEQARQKAATQHLSPASPN